MRIFKTLRMFNLRMQYLNSLSFVKVFTLKLEAFEKTLYFMLTNFPIMGKKRGKSTSKESKALEKALLT